MSTITAGSTYESLTDYQKRCLPATNYWREKNGLPLIDVPKSDEHYHKYFKAVMIPVDNTLTIRPAPTKIPTFSFFERPVKNADKCRPVNLVQIYESIKGEYFKKETEYLRNLRATDLKKYRQEKEKVLHYVCFSGEFKRRETAALIRHSGLLTLDLDHLTDVEGMRKKILEDETVTTELLFISPGGDGLKWIISIDIDECSHLQYFFALEKYVFQKYNLKIDKACKDVSRATFLCHDPNVFINPKWTAIL